MNKEQKNMEQGIRIRTVILLWLLLSGVTSIQAQSAGDIDTLSQWRVDWSMADSYGVFYDHYKYYIEGDTVIDSNTYFKVYKSGYSYEWSFNGSISDYYYYSHIYAGALREHENKWYALSLYGNNEDILLYDFTVNIGDSIWGGLITITDIDTVMVDGEPKKRFHLGCSDCAEYIIEDIGATSGLFEPLFFFENNSDLYCYAIDFVPLWINPNYAWCDLSVSIKEFNSSNAISTYPNPFTTSTTIEYELTEPSRVQLTIYNAIGEVVYTAEERIMTQGKHTFSWTADRLPEGLYYAVLRSMEGVVVLKMVKQ